MDILSVLVSFLGILGLIAETKKKMSPDISKRVSIALGKLPDFSLIFI